MSASSAPSPSDNQRLVLDTWPVMEWLKGRQPVARSFLALLERAQHHEITLYLSMINLGEVYYSSAKEWTSDRADEILGRMQQLPITYVAALNNEVLSAARLKAVHQISYADAFAVSLAIHLECPLLTGDRDFLPLATDGVLNIDWIGA